MVDRFGRERLLNYNEERFQILVTAEFRGHGTILAGNYAPSWHFDTLNHIALKFLLGETMGVRTTEHPAPGLDQPGRKSRQISVVAIRLEGRFATPREGG